MQQGNTKKNTGLIIGIACGAVAVIAAIIIVLVIALGAGGPKGKYVLTGMEDKDGKDLSSLISLMSLGGDVPFIEFKDGGKCDASGVSGSVSASSDDGLSQTESKVECTFTKDTITFTDGKEKEELKFTTDGDKVIITQEGEKMIFTKK